MNGEWLPAEVQHATPNLTRELIPKLQELNVCLPGKQK